MGIKIQQTVYETLEPGEYSAVVDAIEDVTGQFGPQLKWTFRLAGGQPVVGWSSQTFSPKSKLYKWTCAALGRGDLPRDYAFDSDHVLGRLLRLILIVEAGKDGDFNRISEVLPPKRQSGLVTGGEPEQARMAVPPTTQHQPAPYPGPAKEPAFPPPDWLDGTEERVPF